MVVDPDQGIVHRNLLDNDHKLQQDFGGRITVIQTVLPNIGPGALASREDAHSEASLVSLSWVILFKMLQIWGKVYVGGYD